MVCDQWFANATTNSDSNQKKQESGASTEDNWKVEDASDQSFAESFADATTNNDSTLEKNEQEKNRKNG
jgi:hypothetical protein